MADPASARELTESLVAVANRAGLRTSALVTDMNEPLASAAGNAVEVRNAVAFLTGERRDPRLLEVVRALACEMLTLGGIAGTTADAEAQVQAALDGGRAAEVFETMVRVLGGPADFVKKPEEHLPRAAVTKPIPPREPGRVAKIDARALGLAVVALGGGRTRPQDAIDHAVGLTELAGIGVDVGERPLCLVHARDEASAARAAETVRAAYEVGEPPPKRRLVYDRVGPEAH
jgi:thymidine phosphorylase